MNVMSGAWETVAFFDMDHTVLATDCDVSWKNFLVDQGLAPEADRGRADAYWDLYYQGRSPVEEFVAFQLREFVGRSAEEMQELAQRHFNERIADTVYPAARQVITQYAGRGIPTGLVTGTNRVIAQPLVQELGITTLLATEPELDRGRFTGGIVGPFLLKEGKLIKARQYCAALGTDLQGAAFYADSINDLEMLASVGTPVAINPAPALRAEAEARRWRIERWEMGAA